MAVSKKGGLGRGLDALFADAVPVKETVRDKKEPSGEKTDDDGAERVRYLSIHDVKPNKSQPRKTFNEEKIRGKNQISYNLFTLPWMVDSFILCLT